MPSLALCLICKNEVHNFPTLLASVEGCFDEIHVTDTGSTDGTLELLDRYRDSNPAKTKLFVHDFTWVNDFSAARNYSFSHAKTDFVMWMDLDDILANADAFIHWKNSMMDLGDYWLAPYHYGLDKAGNPTCTFHRERVIRNHLGLQWKYFVHEGIWPASTKRPLTAQGVHSWSIKHVRTEEDRKADQMRNLKLFEGRELDARMQYYYGKELFENQKPLEAYESLKKAIIQPLELHDKILALQYASYAAMQLNQFDTAMELARQGIILCPNRSEFHNLIADCYMKLNRFHDAVPWYNAAKSCNADIPVAMTNGALFAQKESYTTYPRHQLAKLYAWSNNFKRAKSEINDVLEFGPNLESAQLLSEIEEFEKGQLKPHWSDASDCNEYVFTCMSGLYEWDEATLHSQGIGGSETAVIHMARELRNQTGCVVRVFQPRKSTLDQAGVIYEPLEKLAPYMKENKPLAHIAWRHNVKITNSPTYLWCHDLAFQGVEQDSIYTEVLALSEFHKNFLVNMCGVKPDKIRVTRNGIDPSLFEGPLPAKIPGRIVWGSSPDRGLDRALLVMDEVHRINPTVTFHIYYGFDNMRKLGKTSEVERFEKMISDRSYATMWGNLPQKQLIEAYKQSEIWLYPTNFLETFCITALETQCAGVRPVVRGYGALPERVPYTTDHDCETPEQIMEYAKTVLNALCLPSFPAKSTKDLSWESVAREWLTFLAKPR